MIMFGKLSVAVIIITMLEILLKKMAHIANVSNFYTYCDRGVINSPM
jgi:hypothetical protein